MNGVTWVLGRVKEDSHPCDKRCLETEVPGGNQPRTEIDIREAKYLASLALLICLCLFCVLSNRECSGSYHL